MSTGPGIHALGCIAASAVEGNVVAPALRLRADDGTITLHATLLASGTTPPAVTLTGTVAFPGATCPGIWVDIKPGAATFDVSYDNGATIAHADEPIPLGGTYALDGVAAGCVLNFPNAAYNANNLYQGVVTTWGDSSGNGLHFGPQATNTKCPLYIVASANINGRRALRGSSDLGRQTELQATHASLNTLFSMAGTVNPCSLLAVFYAANPDADQTLFGCGAAVSNNRTRKWGVQATGDGVYIQQNVSNAGSGLPQSPSLESFSGSSKAYPVCNLWRNSATTARLKCGRASQLASGPFAPGTTTLTKQSVFSRPDSVADQFLDGDCCELSVWDTDLSDADAQAVMDDRMTLWGFPASVPLVVAEGDSIMNGFNTASTVPARWSLTGWTVFQEQANGQTLLDMIGTFPLQIKSHYQPGNPYQVVCCDGGINDRNAGADAATILSRIQQLYTLVSAAKMRFVYCQMHMTTNGAANAVFAAVNAAIAANPAAYCHRFALVWDALQAAGAVPGNAPYYNADGTHLADAGYAIYAQVTQASILSA